MKMSPPTPPKKTNKTNTKTQQISLEKYHHPKKTQAQRDFTDFIAGADVVFIAVLQLHQSCCEEKSLQTRSQNPKARRKPKKNVRTENVNKNKTEKTEKHEVTDFIVGADVIS
jgi:hypothetical protein